MVLDDLEMIPVTLLGRKYGGDKGKIKCTNTRRERVLTRGRRPLQAFTSNKRVVSLMTPGRSSRFLVPSFSSDRRQGSWRPSVNLDKKHQEATPSNNFLFQQSPPLQARRSFQPVIVFPAGIVD